MFKSVFSKYFTAISLIIVSGFLVMSGLQLVLFTRSLTEDKRVLLQENAVKVGI